MNFKKIKKKINTSNLDQDKVNQNKDKKIVDLKYISEMKERGEANFEGLIIDSKIFG